MPIWMYTMCNDNDDNKVASKTKIAMNLAMDEQNTDTLGEFDNFDQDIEFSNNQLHYIGRLLYFLKYYCIF